MSLPYSDLAMNMVVNGRKAKSQKSDRYTSMELADVIAQILGCDVLGQGASVVRVDEGKRWWL